MARLSLAAVLLSTHLIAASASGDEVQHRLAAEATPEETREHYVLRHTADKTAHFEVTVVDRASERVDETTFLVSDLGHGPLLLQTRHVYEDQTVVYEISDVRRKDYIRTSFKMPYTAKTRSGMLREAHSSPNVAMLPALLTITTPGGEWRSIDAEAAEWQRLRELRYSIRPTVSFFLRKARNACAVRCSPHREGSCSSTSLPGTSSIRALTTRSRSSKRRKVSRPAISTGRFATLL